MAADPLSALFHPFRSGGIPRLAAGSSVLFMNARPCAGLSCLSGCGLTAQQYIRPYADALLKQGYDVTPEPDIREDGRYDAVLALVPRQHREAMHDMARALKALKPGGFFAFSAANDGGGGRLKKDVESFGLDCSGEGRDRSRVVWGAKPPGFDAAALEPAIQGGLYQEIPGGGFISRPGIFSWDRIDPGSALLAESVPASSLGGRGADFGCGYGFLSRHAAAGDNVSEIYCIDADFRAVEACRRNLGNIAKARFLWHDIGSGAGLPGALDWIVMNPPFHEGRARDISLGMSFIEAAAQSLRPGGVLWMVANRHLPYEEISRGLFATVAEAAGNKGYKIFRSVR